MVDESLGLRPGQMELFGPMLQSYARHPEGLYRQLTGAQQLACDHWAARVPIGRSGALHSPAKRQVRRYQQSLKRLGLIERVPGQRGCWRPSPRLASASRELTPALAGQICLGFSTELGLALWADCHDVFSRLDEPIHLCLTSPPYPLQRARAYGGPKEREYVDFVCRLLEPIVRHLVPGGSICLNISNDIFLPGSPARSLYRERLVLALHERLGLFKMDELIWHNPSKAPGPIAWASKERYQLNVAWEPVYWFTNDPARVRSDNRRVLQPHSDRQRQLIERGGEQRRGQYGDGANRLQPGSFANATEGAIARNVLRVPHRCPSQTALRRELQRRGLPMHGATMPMALASFLVRLMCAPGELVVDPCDGWGTTSLAAEENGMRWLSTERHLEYVLGKQLRFSDAPGFDSRLPLPPVIA